jgi:hypothetical protein
MNISQPFIHRPICNTAADDGEWLRRTGRDTVFAGGAIAAG